MGSLTPKRLTVAVLLLLLAGLAVWLLWPRAQAVDIVQLKMAPAERVLAVNGRVRPQLVVDVQSPVAGTLVALPFDTGDRVVEGQVLARVDDAPQAARVSQARAAIAAREAQYAQDRRDLARYEAIGEFVTRQRVEEARLAVRQGEDDIRGLRAAAQAAEEELARHVIRAPFSGEILDRPVDPGQTVGPESIIYQLGTSAAPEIVAEVDETNAGELRLGMPARVRLVGSDRVYQARIEELEPRVDVTTGGRPIKLSFLSPPGSAPAGLTAEVSIQVDRRERALTVPREAIDQQGGEAWVLVDEDGRAVRRKISFIDWPASQVIVTSGLSAGDRVLLNPTAVAPGTRIRARQPR